MISGNIPVIALEGIDGSGKGLQFARLKARFERAGLRVGVLDFPCYDSFFGNEIGKFLSGRDGVSAMDVDVKSMSLWYAMDRVKAFEKFDPAGYDVVLLNRSTLANAAYQGTRIKNREELPGFVRWIITMEFEVLGIPKPDLFFIFDIPAATSRKNVAKKGHRDYVGDGADVYEKDIAFMESVREGYIECSGILEGCVVLPCAYEDGNMKPPEEIEETVWNIINERISYEKNV